MITFKCVGCNKHATKPTPTKKYDRDYWRCKGCEVIK